MKKSLIVLLVLGIATLGLAKTRHLGNYSYINTDGKINIAVNAAVAAKNLNRTYLPFVAYLGTDSKITAVVNRSDIVLIYKGKTYHMPTFRELRQNYHRDVMDMTLFSRETEHIFPSDMSKYQFQTNVDFFPARTEGNIVPSEMVTVSDTLGVRTKLYFKNPGIKKGEKAILKIRDSKNPDINGEITITF
ncbi:MAG: hypothetical protein GXO69_06550 [Acidobacteria bacterium]|nr:hypothetical protein [Acidobacteriota bacterium]